MSRPLTEEELRKIRGVLQFANHKCGYRIDGAKGCGCGWMGERTEAMEILLRSEDETNEG